MEIARTTTLIVATVAVGLMAGDPKSRDTLLQLSLDRQAALRDEALRGLIGVKLSDQQLGQLRSLARRQPASAPLVARLVQPNWKPQSRPQPDELDSWMKRLRADGDPAAGERIFFHGRAAKCFICHQVDGRGGKLGPDLSAAGRLSPRRLVESLVTPSREIAPRYAAWSIATTDGKTFTGIFISERGEQEIYADANGKLIHIDHSDIDLRQASPKSIMPDGLVDQFTDRELRDLLAYLRQLK